MPSDNIYQEKRPPGILRRSWRRFCHDIPALVGLYGFIALLLLALFGRYLAPYPSSLHFVEQFLLPPAWSHDGNIAFFFGTDDLGRDVLSRLLLGARITIGAALIISAAAATGGILLGTLAGISHGLRSATLTHILDTLLSIPSLLLVITLIAFLGPRLEYAMIAIALALLPRIIRTVYSAIHREMKMDYVTAARLDGANNRNLLAYYIFPNIAPTLAAELTRVLSLSILDISALGFLRLGAHSASSEWGTMMGDSLNLIYVAPWTIMLPGCAIMLSVMVINLLGDGIRRALLAGIE